jgi:hypothetical protein
VAANDHDQPKPQRYQREWFGYCEVSQGYERKYGAGKEDPGQNSIHHRKFLYAFSSDHAGYST